MKRKILVVIFIMMFFINIFMLNVSATVESVSFNLNKSKTNYTIQNEDIIIILRLDNIVSDRGIISFSGILEYDKNALNFKAFENCGEWSISYNPNTGDFVAENAGLITQSADLGKIIFSPKVNNASNAIITVKDLTVADGTVGVKKAENISTSVNIDINSSTDEKTQNEQQEVNQQKSDEQQGVQQVEEQQQNIQQQESQQQNREPKPSVQQQESQQQSREQQSSVQQQESQQQSREQQSSVQQQKKQQQIENKNSSNLNSQKKNNLESTGEDLLNDNLNITQNEDSNKTNILNNKISNTFRAENKKIDNTIPNLGNDSKKESNGFLILLIIVAVIGVLIFGIRIVLLNKKNKN